MAGPALSWQLRRLRVCASTEIELARWLEARERSERPLPMAGSGFVVVARRQRFGVGQQGRSWHSPPGGLWLSAALPWPSAPAGTAPLALAAAVGLALQLESLGVRPRLKWPNDLLIDGRKLAGVLPRLRWRGSAIRWAQLGVGLNGNNRPPQGAIALAEALDGGRWHPLARSRRLEPLVLAALGWAVAQASAPGHVLAEAQARLWQPAGGWWHQGRLWQVEGLTADGGLRLSCADGALTLDRRCAEGAP